MMNNFLKEKESIQASFNKADKTYDQCCAIQETICVDCLSLLPKNLHKFNTMADFACGTGVSTKHLVSHISHQKCYAIDFAQNLLALAKPKLTNQSIEYILSDFDNPIFNENHLDLIFCNMGLQWAPRLSDTLKRFSFYLKPSGVLLFSLPIQGNFPELKKPYKNPLQKPTHITKILKKSSFNTIKFFIKSHQKSFNSPFEALKYLKNLGANTLISSKGKKPANLSRKHLTKMFTNPKPTTLTYQIACFLAKPK